MRWIRSSSLCDVLTLTTGWCNYTTYSPHSVFTPLKDWREPKNHQVHQFSSFIVCNKSFFKRSGAVDLRVEIFLWQLSAIMQKAFCLTVHPVTWAMINKLQENYKTSRILFALQQQTNTEAHYERKYSFYLSCFTVIHVWGQIYWPGNLLCLSLLAWNTKYLGGGFKNH